MGALPVLDYCVDVAREEAGAWFSPADVPSRYPMLDGRLSRVKVRSKYVKDYADAEVKLMQEALRIPEEERRVFLMDESNRLIGELLLIDWEFYAKKNDPTSAISFSQESALELMTEKIYRHHQRFVNETIMVLQGDIERAKQTDEKN